MLLIAVASFAEQPADKIIGKWESIDGDVKLRFDIFEHDGKYFGKLLWASNLFESDGETRKKISTTQSKSKKCAADKALSTS